MILKSTQFILMGLAAHNDTDNNNNNNNNKVFYPHYYNCISFIHADIRK